MRIIWVALLLSPVGRRDLVTQARPSAEQAGQADVAGQPVTPQQRVEALRLEEVAVVSALLKDYPDDEGPFVLMGTVKARYGDVTAAIEFWKKALVMNPKRADVYYSMGQFAMGKGHYDEAIAHWRKTLEIAPKSPAVHKNIALALMGLGKHSEAIAELNEEVQIAPQSAQAYFLLGQEHLQQTDYDKAKANYERAIALDPNLTNAHYGLFTVHTHLKNRDQAKHYMETFKKLKAEDMKVLKDRNEARDDLLSMQQGAAETFRLAGRLRMARGALAEAERLFKRAVELDPHRPTTLGDLASLYMMSNRPVEALEAYRRAKAMKPNDPICHLNLGVLHAQLGQTAEAEKAFRQVISLAPRWSDGHRELARLYLRAGINLPTAKELAQEAVDLAPLAENYFVLSWALDRNGDPAGALAAMKRAVELEPENETYRRMYERITQRNTAR